MKSLLLMTSATLLLCGCSKQPITVYERYLDASEELQHTVRTDGTRAAADELRDIIDKDPELADVCHGLSHAIGQAAYKRFGFADALKTEDDVCGSGLIHGIIETHLAGIPDLETALFSLCAPGSAKCFHGIGHGLMDRSSNDLPWSLEQCGRFPKASERAQCAEGIFMENADVDVSVHPSEYVKEDDPYFPCRGQSAVNEGVCAFYMPRYYLKLHPRAYEGVLAECVKVPIGPRDACYKGAGSAVMKQNILHPDIAESFCEQVPESAEQFCIAGLSSYYIVHHASSIKASAMCDGLKPQHQKTCRRIVDESRTLYPN